MVRSMEQIEAEMSSPGRLEDREFVDESLQVLHHRSIWSSLEGLEYIEVAEGWGLQKKREIVGLEPGFVKEWLEPAKDFRKGDSSIIKMLETVENCKACTAMESPSLAKNGLSLEHARRELALMEVQELPDVPLMRGTSTQGSKLEFITGLLHEATLQTSQRGISVTDLGSSENEELSWSYFEERDVLGAEETGLVERFLSWDQILTERRVEAPDSEEHGSLNASRCLVSLAEPSVIHPVEVSKSLASLSAQRVTLLCTKHRRTARQVEVDSLSEKLTANSIENEFHRLVAHPELRMDSFNFKMLPVPYMPSQPPAAAPANQVFSSALVRPRSLGGDSLYLDWHLSLSDGCNQASCFQFKKRVKAELEPAPLPALPREPPPSETALLLRLLAAPEPDEPESPDDSSGRKSVGEEVLEGEVVLQRDDPSAAKAADGGVRQRSSFISKTAGAMTEDLSFFMQARKGTVCARAPASKPQNASEKQTGLDQEPPDRGEEKQAPPRPLVKAHAVNLLEEHRTLLAALQSDYCAVQITEKSRVNGRLPAFGVDPAGNRDLMALVKGAAVPGDEPGEGHQQSLRGCATMWTLRQTASNLIEYGVRVAYLYLEHSVQTMPFLSMAVLRSKSALEAAYSKVEAGLAVDSPKLKCLHDILKTAVKPSEERPEAEGKILILADRRAFISMYNELVDSGLRPFQLDRDETILRVLMAGEAEAEVKLKRAVDEALTVSNCLLVSYGYLRPCFPLSAFSTIIQYSDGRLSLSDADLTKIQEILAGATCHRQVIRARDREFEKKDGSNTAEAGHPIADSAEENLPQASNRLQDQPRPLGVSPNTRPDPSLTNGNGQNPVNPAPNPLNLQGSHVNPADRGKPILIVANMLDSELSMRRSLYQSVVQLEKTARAQVVERDMMLSVDLVLHGATCLSIFTPDRLGLDPLCLDDVNRLKALLPGCFEEAVDSHLRAVSFAYKTAVLIFEGPPSFLRAVLPELTPLHSAALGLDLNLQCLLSNCPETTNRFALKVIESIRTLPKGRSGSIPPEPLPPLPETLSPLEAFLTAFPSLNAVGAHAIVSSGVNVSQFAQLPEEQQLALTRRFDVPVRSLRLVTLQFNVHSGRELERGDRIEESLPYEDIAGGEKTGYYEEREMGMPYRNGPALPFGDEMGLAARNKSQSKAYQAVQEPPVRGVPYNSHPQQTGRGYLQSGHIPFGHSAAEETEEYYPEGMDAATEAYHDFPTAAEIMAEPKAEWPSAREIAGDEADSPLLYGRHVADPDGPGEFLTEDLYEGLPFFGESGFEDEERLGGRISRSLEGWELGVGRFDESGRPQPPVPKGAATVAAWEDPRDARGGESAADALESWLASKRAQKTQDAFRSSPYSKLSSESQRRQWDGRRPVFERPITLSSQGRYNHALGTGLTPSQGRVPSQPQPRSVSMPCKPADSRTRAPQRKGLASRSRGSADSGGGAEDAFSDGRLERPELQQAIAHFRTYEYVPEAARKGAGGKPAAGVNTPRSVRSRSELSTPKPYLMEVPQDKRATEVLGFKRLGRDKQTRLSWGSTPTSRTSSEEGNPARKKLRTGSLVTI